MAGIKVAGANTGSTAKQGVSSAEAKPAQPSAVAAKPVENSGNVKASSVATGGSKPKKGAGVAHVLLIIVAILAIVTVFLIPLGLWLITLVSKDINDKNRTIEAEKLKNATRAEKKDGVNTPEAGKTLSAEGDKGKSHASPASSATAPKKTEGAGGKATPASETPGTDSTDGNASGGANPTKSEDGAGSKQAGNIAALTEILEAHKKGAAFKAAALADNGAGSPYTKLLKLKEVVEAVANDQEHTSQKKEVKERLQVIESKLSKLEDRRTDDYQCKNHEINIAMTIMGDTAVAREVVWSYLAVASDLIDVLENVKGSETSRKKLQDSCTQCSAIASEQEGEMFESIGMLLKFIKTIPTSDPNLILSSFSALCTPFHTYHGELTDESSVATTAQMTSEFAPILYIVHELSSLNKIKDFNLRHADVHKMMIATSDNINQAIKDPAVFAELDPSRYTACYALLFANITAMACCNLAENKDELAETDIRFIELCVPRILEATTVASDKFNELAASSKLNNKHKEYILEAVKISKDSLKYASKVVTDANHAKAITTIAAAVDSIAAKYSALPDFAKTEPVAPVAAPSDKLLGGRIAAAGAVPAATMPARV